MPDEITRVIVNHCSPVLLGCKPTALFTLRSEDAFVRLAVLLCPGLNLRVLQKTEGSLLVLVFEKAGLLRAIRERSALALLSGMGYPTEASLFTVLDYLRGRFIRDDFPHEIGLFLGYPAEDVIGFVRHKGRNYKLSGYWKVYGDVEQAKKCFRRFDTCRECFRAFLPEN
jgi:hypothetical protein